VVAEETCMWVCDTGSPALLCRGW